MSITERKTQLMFFKSSLDQERARLKEMTLRHEEVGEGLPEDVVEKTYHVLLAYRDSLKLSLQLCDTLRDDIETKLRELE